MRMDHPHSKICLGVSFAMAPRKDFFLLRTILDPKPKTLQS